MSSRRFSSLENILLKITGDSCALARHGSDGPPPPARESHFPLMLQFGLLTEKLSRLLKSRLTVSHTCAYLQFQANSERQLCAGLWG
jgi:hypothetical protein